MDTFTSLSALIGALLSGGLLVYYLRANPSQFTSHNVQKSLTILGMLALLLIALLSFIVSLMRMR